MNNHFAYFDVLSISVKLFDELDNLDKHDIQIFSFLACLLSLYRGKSSTSWGYRFAVTTNGYPYSTELDKAIDILITTGQLRSPSLSVTDGGKLKFDQLKNFNIYNKREEAIKGATGAMLALPLGTIYSAIFAGTEISNAVQLSQKRLLLTEIGQDSLYEQFADLSAVIGINVDDLMVPAIVWLSYFADISLDEVGDTN